LTGGGGLGPLLFWGQSCRNRVTSQKVVEKGEVHKGPSFGLRTDTKARTRLRSFQEGALSKPQKKPEGLVWHRQTGQT